MQIKFTVYYFPLTDSHKFQFAINWCYLLLLILGAGSCDFENDWCGWRQDSGSSNSRWQRMTDDQIAATNNLRLDKLTRLPETKEYGAGFSILFHALKIN